MKEHKRILAALLDTAWLISEDWLEMMIDIVINGGDLEAVEKKLSNRLPETSEAFVRGSVAHFPIEGPIFPKANIFTEMSGAISVERLAREFTEAEENSDISSIILNYNTPGGAVTGINEMSKIIKNSKKPVYSYVNGTAASAGYWLASSAKEIIVDETARLGSIGVVVAMRRNKGDERVIEIVSSNAPNKRPDINSKEGKEAVIKELDALEKVFINTVATNRNVSVQTVKNDFGRGGVLVGADAIEAGMADRIGSFEGLLAELNNENNEGGRKMPGTTKGSSSVVVTLETLKKDHPEVYEAAKKEGIEEANVEHSKKVKALEENIASLESDNEALLEDANKMEARVKKLEKNDAIRAAKAVKAVADGIIETKLNDSDVPKKLHSKVKAHISHDDYVSEDGVLDKKAFSKAVDEEIKDWEFEGSSNDVLGGGSSARSVEEDNTESEDQEDDATADSLLSYIQ